MWWLGNEDKEMPMSYLIATVLTALLFFCDFVDTWQMVALATGIETGRYGARECYSELCSYNNTTVGVVITDLCECSLDGLQGHGALIVAQNDSLLEQSVLWGEMQLEQYRTEVVYHDFDNSQCPEVVVLYVDESGSWGYIFRVIHQDHRVTLQKTSLPQTLHGDLEWQAFLKSPKTGEISMPGKTWPDMATVRVSFDADGDSLSVFLDRQ
jgi:hypothetical protein